MTFQISIWDEEIKRLKSEAPVCFHSHTCSLSLKVMLVVGLT